MGCRRQDLLVQPVPVLGELPPRVSARSCPAGGKHGVYYLVRCEQHRGAKVKATPPPRGPYHTAPVRPSWVARRALGRFRNDSPPLPGPLGIPGIRWELQGRIAGRLVTSAREQLLPMSFHLILRYRAMRV